jgi:dipeptidyl-peptidase-4
MECNSQVASTSQLIHPRAMKSYRFLAVAFVLALAVPEAQGSEATTAQAVYRDRVEPHWFAGTDERTNRFWYCVSTGKGQREFILVDADEGKRSAAFDHARLAEALSKATGHAIDPKSLPIFELEFGRDLRSVTLRGAGIWRLDLSSYALTPVVEATTNENRIQVTGPRFSAATGIETEISFANQSGADVNLHYGDPSGLFRPCGMLRSGERRLFSTYSGQVWWVSSLRGEWLAFFEATLKPALALIEKRPSGAARRQGEANSKSPDGHWQALVRGDNLFLRSLSANDQNEVQLTYDGNPSNSYAHNAEWERAVSMQYDAQDPEPPEPGIHWAPDSRHFVALRYQRSEERRVYLVESSPQDQLQPRLDSYPYLKPGDQVPCVKPHLFDVESKRQIPVSDALFSNPWSITELRWDSNSSRFTFLYNQRGHQALGLLAVTADTGAVSSLIDERSNTFIDYSTEFFWEYLDDTHEIIWSSERDGWNHLYLYDGINGALKKQLTHGPWVVRHVDFVDRKQRQIWFQAGGIHPQQDPYYVQVCRVNLDGSGLTVLTEGDGTHQARFSPDRRYFIDTWSRVDLPPVNELRRSSDGHLVCRLEEADASQWFASGCKTPERLVAKGRDGVTDIFGIFYRPAHFEPARRYPVIEQIYAGPHGFSTPKEFRAASGQQALADRGFIVVQMDGMGTSGRSKKFHDVCWKNLRDAGFPDRILWIQAAAASHPFMDLSRIGIYGGSAGGQNALRGMLDHADFYKVCVSDSGCHDNRMDKIWWNEQWMGWPVDDSYGKSSNVEDAAKLRGKLLLMVGELDRNVDPASTLQVVNALINADKDFELLYVPGAGHAVAVTPYGWRRLEEFFVKNL